MRPNGVSSARIGELFPLYGSGSHGLPGSRIHVQCNPGDGAINYFALSVANADASRVLSLVATAVAARRPLFITYDPNDVSGDAIGCSIANCRLIQAVFLERD